MLQPEEISTVVSARARLDSDVLARFCLSYWLFNNAEIASRISKHSSEKFFSYCYREYRTQPRGTEPTHFRGVTGLRILNRLEDVSHGRAEWIVGFIFGATNDAKSRVAIGAALPFLELHARVLSLYDLGMPMSAKVGRLGERILNYKISWSGYDS
jgi:hypothetical protein